MPEISIDAAVSVTARRTTEPVTPLTTGTAASTNAGASAGTSARPETGASASAEARASAREGPDSRRVTGVQNTGKGDDVDEVQIEDLKKRDHAVRLHEEAHVAAGGHYVVGMPSYEFVTGPDRKRYATNGEVRLDTSVVPDDPIATIRKMDQVARAALAPVDPSGQDRRVSAEAHEEAARARKQANELKTQKAVPATTTSTGKGRYQAPGTSGTGEHLDRLG
jgi:hypothetical protein